MDGCSMITIRLDPQEHTRIVRAARQRQGTSINQFCLGAIRDALKHMEEIKDETQAPPVPVQQGSGSESPSG